MDDRGLTGHDQDLGLTRPRKVAQMDLLSCPACGSLFYSAAPGAHRCPKCAEQLNLELSRVTSIPLEARWLDADHPRQGPSQHMGSGL
jgi:tRNA(Ile2) C34 agmatinyltransferase TiaS